MKSAVRSSAERSTTPAATAAARRSAERAPVAAEVFFVVAQGAAKGRAGVAEGPLPEVVLAAGAASAVAGIGICTAEPMEAFAEAAEARVASPAAGEQFTAAGAHGVESAHHFAGAAQAAGLASAVGSDGRHRVSLPRDAAADRGERGEDLTRTDVRFAVEQLGFME